PFLGYLFRTQIRIPRQPSVSVQVRHRQGMSQPVFIQTDIDDGIEAAGPVAGSEFRFARIRKTRSLNHGGHGVTWRHYSASVAFVCVTLCTLWHRTLPTRDNVLYPRHAVHVHVEIEDLFPHRHEKNEVPL